MNIRIDFFFCLIFSLSLFQIHCNNFYSTNYKNTIIAIENNTQCDLQKGKCEFEISKENTIWLEFFPKPIVPNNKHRAILHIQNLEWTPKEIDFIGVDMEMSFNRPEWKRKSPHEFTTDFVIESCASGEIRWKALVLLQNNDNKLYGIPFYFKAGSKKR
ncbi:MAG: hypothetical protein L6Q54_14830 [Leptospiraceae bacterium]|nr:hypothetical protein [Leptospiraceae bacterium]MCK6382509.1 hypothetical protein [Leptospiraceae bacterium]NUM41156.1 hypothetical protein [Leptospiraceae bacterium]